VVVALGILLCRVLVSKVWFWSDGNHDLYRYFNPEVASTMNISGCKFRHYKGMLYKVLYETTDTETGEQRLVYRTDDDPKLWDRPKQMFLETLPDGRRRFEPILNPKIQSTVELRRTEAVVAIDIVEGSIDIMWPELPKRGELSLIKTRCDFTLKVVLGHRSQIPGDFFDGEFELRYSDEQNRIFKLMECRVPEGSDSYDLQGTFNYDKSMFSFDLTP